MDSPRKITALDPSPSRPIDQIAGGNSVLRHFYWPATSSNSHYSTRYGAVVSGCPPLLLRQEPNSHRPDNEVDPEAEGSVACGSRRAPQA
jgi:hypothetical protein